MSIVFISLVTNQIVSFGFLTACALKSGYYHPFLIGRLRKAPSVTQGKWQNTAPRSLCSVLPSVAPRVCAHHEQGDVCVRE